MADKAEWNRGPAVQTPRITDSLFESHPFERAQRDAHAIMGQIVLQHVAMEDAGRARLGLHPLSPTF